MQRTLRRSATALALGAGLLAAVASGCGSSNNAATSSPVGTTTSPTTTQQQQAKRGGTMKVNMSATDVDFSDPSLAYGSISWQIEYATALKLYNYPDQPAPEGSKIQPEAASGFPVISNDGKTYTINVKPGFKFSDGKPVTAANFAFAINRALSPTMQSPAASFIGNIVGAQAVLDKKAKTASGVQVQGNKLVIHLTQPDGGLLAKLGMPFFQAIETTMKTDPKGVNAYPSAGPYYIASRVVGRQLVVKRNPHYTGSRPGNIDTFMITVNTNIDQSLLQVKANQVDYDMGGLPPTAHSQLASQFGINKGRYFVYPLVETDYVALNTSRPAFSSAERRKGANFAIDRQAMLRVRGAFSGTPTDQILPPGMGGYRDEKIYPTSGTDVAKAKQMFGGSCPSLSIWSANSPIGQSQAQVLKENFSKAGCNSTVKLFQGFQVYTAAGAKGAGYDAAIVGWNQDYPDPYDFLDVLLNGNNIHAQNNNNLAYFNNPGINSELAAANRLTGSDRYKTYGNLDVKITRNYAPWASFDNRNQREFVSARTGGYVFQPANASADLNTFFLK
jgi:oligopeptide transport system substrate-binding protein